MSMRHGYGVTAVSVVTLSPVTLLVPLAPVTLLAETVSTVVVSTLTVSTVAVSTVAATNPLQAKTFENFFPHLFRVRVPPTSPRATSGEMILHGRFPTTETKVARAYRMRETSSPTYAIHHTVPRRN